jgi:D-alanyl-lipoteichoic acid acyltransferase DltB (MBOAT superfamily)
MGIIKQLQAKKPTDGLSREEKKKKKARDLLVQKVVVTLGVLSVLGTLFMSKYYTFVADNINLLMYLKGKPMPMPGIQVMTAVGLSYFVLQSVAYMVDVYWDKVDVQRNPFKILMYLTFFPTLVQGPIALMRDMQGTLFAGESLKLENIERGYIRIIWGAFKKIVVADRISVAVNSLYDVGTPRTGMYIAAAAIFFTIQEYMDFSGCVDIAIGSAEIFGIVLPENFRQPFVSRNASEFWRRWHITLGTFFKTYIFYPVSLSKLTKKWNKFGKKKLNPYGTRLGDMAIALLPVWLCNGIWHGPKWTYIFYGIYYFIIIMIE